MRFLDVLVAWGERLTVVNPAPIGVKDHFAVDRGAVTWGGAFLPLELGVILWNFGAYFLGRTHRQ